MIQKLKMYVRYIKESKPLVAVFFVAAMAGAAVFICRNAAGGWDRLSYKTPEILFVCIACSISAICYLLSEHLKPHWIGKLCFSGAVVPFIMSTHLLKDLARGIETEYSQMLSSPILLLYIGMFIAITLLQFVPTQHTEDAD